MIDYSIVSAPNQPFVFFLHGWGGSKESFYLVKNHIALICNMVFVSFSGFGESKEPEKPYTVEDYANELKELISNLTNEKVIFVCHSFGARVAVKFANLYPKLVNKIMIIDGAGIKPKRSIKYYCKIYKYKRLKRKVQQGKIDKKELENYGSSDYKLLSNVMKQTFVNIVNEDLKKCYKKINCPMLLFWGEKDEDTPLYMAKKIKKLTKNSALIIVKNAGHFSYLEDRITFFEVLKEFILNV
ncbi:MAG: alpha/beta hydrolase [Clostridia bacterium]|nr:alpha/beta hydrolase [Clostridia bacterium]